jgi:hypothetical protein
VRTEKIVSSIVSSVKVSSEDVKELAIRVADYLEKKLTPDFKRETRQGAFNGWEITFKKPNSKDSYDVSVRPDFPEEVKLVFYSEKEIKSETQSDPSKNYETTTGRYVTLKKKKLKREVENEQKAIKAIDAFFNK